MRLRYLLVTLISVSLLACVSDPKGTQDSVEAGSSAAAASVPQVKVNPDSPAFASQKPRQATQATTPPPADYNRTITSDNPNSKEYQEKLKSYEKTKNEPIKRKAAPAPVVKKTVPDACTLVSPAFVGKVIGVDPAYIALRDGSGKAGSNQSSCFFKWEHDGIGNAGILIQAQTNPLPDEFDDWASYYINAKRNQGDKSPDGIATYRYKNFTAIGVSGAYNYELARYYWRDTKDRVFMVAFNIPATEEVQLGWAEKLAKEVMNNAN